MVERGAQKEEQCISAHEMLLVRIGYKMLLVWRCGPQEKEHIEKDEKLLVGSGAQNEEECRA